MPLRRAATFAALLSFTGGCSSAYIPRPGPRVSILMEGGTIAYQRDGKRYEGGLFGGDIEEAVKGNPQAEEYARAYKAGTIGGFVGSMLGLGGMIGGLSLAAAESQPGAGQNASVPGLAIAGAGLVAYLVGAAVMFNAVPHLYDAVNVYNDGLASPTP